MATLELYTAQCLPQAVEEAVDAIADAASDVCFTEIHKRLRELGYPCTGDVMPYEWAQIEETFKQFVRMVAINNEEIQRLNGDI